MWTIANIFPKLHEVLSPFPRYNYYGNIAIRSFVRKGLSKDLHLLPFCSCILDGRAASVLTDSYDVFETLIGIHTLKDVYQAKRDQLKEQGTYKSYAVFIL